MSDLMEITVEMIKRGGSWSQIDDNGIVIIDKDNPYGEEIKRRFFDKNKVLRKINDIEIEHLNFRNTPLFIMVRSVPTQDIINRLTDSYGDQVKSLVEEWKNAWDFISRGKFDELTNNDMKNMSINLIIKNIEKNVKILKTNQEKREESEDRWIAEENRLYKNNFERKRHQHLLEDATVLTNLLRKNVNFTIIAYMRAKRDYCSFSQNEDGTFSQKRITSKEKLYITDNYFKSSPYWLLKPFLNNAERIIIEVSTFEILMATLLDMSRQGHKKAFLKRCGMKEGTWVVDLYDVETMEDAINSLSKSFGLKIKQFMNEEFPKFMVQEFMPFEYEHRFFIVDGKIAASTSSDRFLSLTDCEKGVRLDSRVSKIIKPAYLAGYYDKGETSSNFNRSLVAMMAKKVKIFLKEMKEDEIGKRWPAFFSVDVGALWCSETKMWKVAIIELNTARHAGLYAVNYEKIAECLGKIYNKKTDEKNKQITMNFGNVKV